ncbi:S1 family peptidase [Limibacterium fermenti]|uniref:S1 family peptidase n=1 Tax=Limibacterium fermenti TaxID=3229863 RepID=UPI003A7273E0
MYNKLANATLKIVCGNSSGSGFHFCDKQIIVTNFHVIKEALYDNSIILRAYTENHEEYKLKLLYYSDEMNYDFAILHSIDSVSEERCVLRPKLQDRVPRGTDIIFSGYPHGIDHLLVHNAIVSGYPNEKAFYIDGSVNGGNSGGPIIDISDFSVIGIVTQRRFLGSSELNSISAESNKLIEHCKSIAGRGSVSIMGIDFNSLTNMIGRSFAVSNAIIEANANSGIGIGFNIKYVAEKYKDIYRILGSSA